MKSRLLSKREFDALLETDSLQGLITALTGTAYRKTVEAALARTSGMDCIAQALRDDLVNTVGKVHKFYRGRAGEMTAMVLRIYDIQNLKAILRGLTKQVPLDEILFSVLPIGELEEDLLSELARAPNPRAVIDLMATMVLPFAQPLLQLRVDRPGAEITEMELALDQWFYRQSFQYLQTTRHVDGILLSALQLEADLINLLTMLRFAHAPRERKFLREWLHTDELERLLVGPGKLPFAMLVRAGRQDTVAAAVETLVGTPYKDPLEVGLKTYANSALLSDIEKQLQRFRLIWMSRQITKDPLGIGVLLGYLALKINEVNNIRWIAQGINLGFEEDNIRAELEYPP
jgi:vacuolar-type H+-ATPase subunit C/Vma6